MPDFTTFSMTELKDYCQQNNVYVDGDKRKKTSYIEAIEHHNRHNNIVEKVPTQQPVPNIIIPFLLPFLIVGLIIVGLVKLSTVLVGLTIETYNKSLLPKTNVADKLVWDDIFNSESSVLNV